MEGLLLVTDFVIFILIALTLLLLRPQTYKITFWISPAMYVYSLFGIVLATALQALNQGAAGNAIANPAELWAVIGALVIAAAVGVVLGWFIGGRIELGRKPDGKPTYTGGRLLVVILLILLIPRAIVGVADVLALASSSLEGSFTSASGVFLPLDALSGSLFVLGAFLTILWRARVARRLSAPASGARA